MTPDVHDDGALEKGRYVEDAKEKGVCNLVHLVSHLCIAAEMIEIIINL